MNWLRQILLQFDAFFECLREQVSLAVAGDKRGVDFRGFHFSSLLFNRVGRVLKRKKFMTSAIFRYQVAS